jgi:hypothetical protein
MAIGHRDGEKLIVDVIRGRRGPFDPQQLTQDYAALARQYNIREVRGDHYSAEWVASAWRNAGLNYKTSDITASQIYLEALPTFTRNLASLPNHPTLIRELLLFERSPQRSGKDTISHPRNCHDDYSNSCCLLLSMLAGKRGWSSLSGDAWTATRAWAATPQRSSDTFWPLFGKDRSGAFAPTRQNRIARPPAMFAHLSLDTRSPKCVRRNKTNKRNRNMATAYITNTGYSRTVVPMWSRAG